ncbi:MAG: alpha/beta fold hydrolase [Pseudomonadota bacterium]
MWHLDDTHGTSAGRVAAGRAGDGPPLVLAHGWPWSSYSWHRVIPHLAARFTVHWYDMPGFGRSEMAPLRAPSLDTQGEVFGEMLDAWGLADPHVVAHDFGGAVTLRAHLLHGRDYACLTLMNVVAMRPWGSDFFDHVGRHVDAFTGLPPHIHAGLVDAYIGGALVQPLPQDDRARLVEPWLTEAGRTAFYAQFALADERFTAEMEARYDDIRCPVAILWGEDDPWIPLSRGQALAEAVGVDLAPLPGLGHLPQLEGADRVATALLTALEAD